MHVHALAWIVLAGIILTMIVVDIVGHVRTPHEPTLKEATWWSVAYIAIALIFGAIVWAVWGPQYGQEYLGGYITEKALSIDNLFVFVIILSTFRVPRKNQQEVLLAGIIIALVLRLIFILAGAALIENFSWVFYLFGARAPAMTTTRSTARRQSCAGCRRSCPSPTALSARVCSTATADAPTSRRCCCASSQSEPLTSCSPSTRSPRSTR